MATAHPDLPVRLAPLDRLERFAPLMKAAFGLPVAENHFAWKYLANPAGRAVGFEALGPDGPVAFHGVVPSTYWVRGQRTRVYKTVDAMTHPEYRGHGLFPMLAQRTYAHILAEEGRCTVIGTPGPSAFPTFVNRLGFRLLYTIPLVFLPRVVHRVVRFRRRTGEVSFTSAGRAADLEPYLSVRSRPSRGISIELSPEFLQWRGFDHAYWPAQACLAWRDSEPIGMCLFHIDRSRCMIRLADFVDLDTYRRSYSALADYLFERTDTSVLYTWEPVDEHRKAVLSRCGFLKNPLRRGPASTREFFVTRSQPRQVHGEDWLCPSGFDVQHMMDD